MKRRRGFANNPIANQAQLQHKNFIDSYASHLQRQSSQQSRSLSSKSRRTKTSAEFGSSPRKSQHLSRCGTSKFSRHDSKQQNFAFAQEVQDAIAENNCALTQKPTSIEEQQPPSFREPINANNVMPLDVNGN